MRIQTIQIFRWTKQESIARVEHSGAGFVVESRGFESFFLDVKRATQLCLQSFGDTIVDIGKYYKKGYAATLHAAATWNVLHVA